ncbi:ureidoglycolate lyase [Affinibrenneria salicis]|nr:ureidoglycolate lyase [Affinibrenneria salicis]
MVNNSNNQKPGSASPPSCIINARPINAADFSPFGVLFVAVGHSATHRHQATHSDTRIETQWATTPPRADYCDIRLMEKHPLSTQAFFPLDVARYLIVVCPDADGQPDSARARAFVADGRTAIQYHQGIWHCNMTALDRPGLFINLVQKNGGPQDCIFMEVTPYRVALN